MADNAGKPGMLRVAAAVILGCIVGSILFLVVAMGIGAVNDRMGMQIPVNLLIGENILSAVLLILFLLVCIAFFVWQVWNTPPTEKDSEDYGPEELE
jgi:hypothetical protein